MDKKQRFKLKKFINELKAIKGRHTELVSVYIPAGYDLNKIIQHLQQEQHTAGNIKDARTRKNVIDSLERAIVHLRLFKKTPENGLAIFSGNASDKENKTDIKVWSIEPPEPLNTRMYRCDQTFVLDILENMMEVKEAYGLIVIDRRDGDIGLLKGTAIIPIVEFKSDVPGKTTKGGQCLSKNSVVQINDGDIEKIENLHNPYIVKSANFENGKLIDSCVTNKWDTKKGSYKIITKYPRIEIESSKDHVFFVRDDELVEKSASDLKVGDYLLMPEKIEIKGKIQNLNFEHISLLNEDFAQFLGYYLGDGNSDTNRIVFSEQNEELANYYKKFLSTLFSLDVKVRFRETKNYHEIRIYNKKLFVFIKKEFPELKKALNSEIPKKLLRSPNNVIAKFVKGLFDAEGYVTKDELSMGMNNKYLIQQLQMLLLRFGIIGSFCEYNNKRNKYSNNFRYTLRITDIDSLKKFKEDIGLSFSKKNDKLNKLIENRSKVGYIRQIFHNGKYIRKIIEQYGLNKNYFTKVSNFFLNKRQMSKNTFENSILNQVKNKGLYSKLKEFLNYNLIPVKIKKIQKLGKTEMSDISVKNQNFIANCLIVHNSQSRYAGIREEATKEFFKKVGSAANKEFLEMKNLKGILIGGPGPTKHMFIDGHYMNNEIKKKIISIQDLSYTGDFGLNELVEKSQEVLAKEAITEEKKILNRFFEVLAKEPEKAAYGKKETEKAIDMGAVEVLLLSESLDDNTIEDLSERAEKTGSRVDIISTETKEGIQLREIGGMAAILRFQIG